MGYFLSVLLAFSALHAAAAPLKVALILDRGGKDDKSFNSAAYRGATEAKEKLGIQLKEIEASDDTLFEPAMRSFAQKKFDLIIAVGVAQAEAVKKIAAQNPGVKFALIDAPVEMPNVRSLMFKEHEGSYLMGAIAAMKTKTGAVGFIGGMDIPLIRRFQMGFEQGAKATKPGIKVLTNYIGVTGEAWNNPTKGKELATNQYGRGADIIFVAAGNSNHGVFDAAEQQGKFAMGVDSNQNYIKPGRILTSMIKGIDHAVFETIKETQAGAFKAEVRYFGLKDKGIDWALDEHNKGLFTKDDLAKIDAVKARINSGKIQVRDYYTSR